jgi:outer membrane protein assembly factor BamB
MPRDTSNWCVDDKVLYTAVEDLLWRVDAEYGTVLDMLPLPDESQRNTHDWGYVAQNEAHLYGSSVKRGSSYTDFWGGPAWYDGTQGPGTWKVCSGSLFALNKADTTTAWQYTHGRIINPTIALADNVIAFVECRHPKVMEAPTGRIELEELWLDQYLVALDASTGEKLWEKSIDLPDGIVVYFLVIDSGTILVTSSENNNYHIHAFDLGDGSDKWNATHAWPSDNHGGHMQHPAVANGVIFLEPMGYRVSNGEVVTDKMGAREGCATVAATQNALIYRGQSRRVAMWDIEEQRVSSWLNLRPSCWLSVVPSGGMILAPEGGGGCSCGGWIETSLGFIPASLNKPL